MDLPLFAPTEEKDQKVSRVGGQRCLDRAARSTGSTAPTSGAVPSLTERLAAYFRARPNTWIDGMELASVAGSYAWRSRASDLRRAPYGMVIENRQRRRTGHAGWCQMWDFGFDECHCKGVTVIKSEYRYVREA